MPILNDISVSCIYMSADKMKLTVKIYFSNNQKIFDKLVDIWYPNAGYFRFFVYEFMSQHILNWWRNGLSIPNMKMSK